MNFVAWAVIAVLFNVLDSVTTHIALNRLPETVRAKEANFIMRGLMEKHPLVADVVKQVGVLALIFYFASNIDNGGTTTVAFFAIAFGLVVCSNTYTIIARLILKRKVDSPIMALPKLLHLPDKIDYLFIVAEMLFLTWLIGTYIFNLSY